MQLEIWDGGNRQEWGEARQLEAQPEPPGTVTFKWQMEEQGPGRKAEKVPPEGCGEDVTSVRAMATEGTEGRIHAEGSGLRRTWQGIAWQLPAAFGHQAVGPRGAWEERPVRW